MGILINKRGLEYLDLTEVKQPIEAMNLPSFCNVKESQTKNFRLAYYCTNCGSHLLGIWKDQRLRLSHIGHNCMFDSDCRKEHDCSKVDVLIDEIDKKYLQPMREKNRKELEELARLSHCPICGATLKREEGYCFVSTVDTYTCNKNDPLFSHIDTTEYKYGISRSRADDEEIKKLEQKAEQFASNCDFPFVPLLSAADSETISSSPTKLKEYLKNLIETEINIYSLINRLKVLYVQQEACRQNIVASKYLPLFAMRNNVEIAESTLSQKNKIVGQLMFGKAGVATPSKPNPPVLGTPNLFNKKKVLARNAALQSEYQSRLIAYEEELKQHKSEVDRMISTAKDEAKDAETTVKKLREELLQLEQDENLSLSARSAKELVDDEIELAESTLKKLFDCRNKLYGYNIVFDKYRNVVALSTFYEYLMAGRCTSLEGTSGAYNMYENELRANIIIGQLSQVISKLEEIKKTQYMIYSALKTANNHLNQLNQTMNTALTSIQTMEKSITDISENTNVIAHNTAVTAYYSKVNAELTNALGFMIASR